ncbi:ChbG/HpnK family deacetylase [candidate division KSB1 bacterium]|nr:ChbG/HpnK family deacetylase [candidate division KSB1 bacterium]
MKQAFVIFIILIGLLNAAFAQTTAELLGYAADDRVLIINADDFGMCHAENVATINLLSSNRITSATIMVPCSWFPESAEFCRKNPQSDVGVHLTLTAEWGDYKWGSVASAAQIPSLLTAEGYFPDNELWVELYAQPEQVELELRAQIEKALQFGVIPTHIDNHMASVYGLILGKHFLEIIYELSAEYGLPFRLPRDLSPPFDQLLPEVRKNALKAFAAQKVEQGFALPDFLISGEHGSTYEETFDMYCDMLTNLMPGVTELYIHAAVESDEIKAITNAWRARDWDYRIFKSDEMHAFIDSLGIQLVGWRDLQQLQAEQIGSAVEPIEKHPAPDQFELVQNFPNPFNAATTIEFTLQTPSEIKLAIYNALGSEVTVLLEGFRDQGQYEISWNAEDCASGVYVARLIAPSMVISRKMLLIR